MYRILDSCFRKWIRGTVRRSEITGTVAPFGGATRRRRFPRLTTDSERLCRFPFGGTPSRRLRTDAHKCSARARAVPERLHSKRVARLVWSRSSFTQSLDPGGRTKSGQPETLDQANWRPQPQIDVARENKMVRLDVRHDVYYTIGQQHKSRSYSIQVKQESPNQTNPKRVTNLIASAPRFFLAEVWLRYVRDCFLVVRCVLTVLNDEGDVAPLPKQASPVLARPTSTLAAQVSEEWILFLGVS